MSASIHTNAAATEKDKVRPERAPSSQHFSLNTGASALTGAKATSISEKRTVSEYGKKNHAHAASTHPIANRIATIRIAERKYLRKSDGENISPAVSIAKKPFAPANGARMSSVFAGSATPLKSSTSITI